jgi:hypothetical protein
VRFLPVELDQQREHFMAFKDSTACSVGPVLVRRDLLSQDGSFDEQTPQPQLLTCCRCAAVPLTPAQNSAVRT